MIDPRPEKKTGRQRYHDTFPQARNHAQNNSSNAFTSGTPIFVHVQYNDKTPDIVNAIIVVLSKD